jgi:hypothetical protein
MATMVVIFNLVSVETQRLRGLSALRSYFYNLILVFFQTKMLKRVQNQVRSKAK